MKYENLTDDQWYDLRFKNEEEITSSWVTEDNFHVEFNVNEGSDELETYTVMVSGTHKHDGTTLFHATIKKATAFFEESPEDEFPISKESLEFFVKNIHAEIAKMENLNIIDPTTKIEV